MKIIVRVVIIFIAIIFVRLLRRWIRRLIFILILFCLAFLIYGIFNPSGAGRLWYNIRTFPTRIVSWISSSTEFLNYDDYKSSISSIGTKINIGNDSELEYIDDEVVSVDDELQHINNETIGDIQLNQNEIPKNSTDDVKITRKISQSTKTSIIKTFPKSIKFIEIPGLKENDKNNYENNENDKNNYENYENYENDKVITGYSKADLLGIINKYIEKNLDDDVDILVTVEYEDDSSSPNRIILNTQPKD